MSSKVYAKRKRIARAWGRRMPNNEEHPAADLTREHQKYCRENGYIPLDQFKRIYLAGDYT